MERTCGNCALLSAFGVCPYFKVTFDPATAGCPKWEAQLETCEICGNPTTIATSAILLEDEQNHILCAKCSKELGYCSTCAQSLTCDFETNPSPLPKVVMQTTRSGNMVTQQQIMNPERIKITCHNCTCWNKEEEYCYRITIGNCVEGKWRMKKC